MAFGFLQKIRFCFVSLPSSLNGLQLRPAASFS